MAPNISLTERIRPTIELQSKIAINPMNVAFLCPTTNTNTPLPMKNPRIIPNLAGECKTNLTAAKAHRNSFAIENKPARHLR